MAAGIAAILASACSEQRGATAPPVHDVGLFTSLPILWSEHGRVEDFVKSTDQAHWAVRVLERHRKIRALDRTAPMPADLRLLVMAQPRPLSPDENVALDDWVRAGGRLLLFTDPMLTQESAFAIGDRRRPVGTVLLSPILARWGLTLEFDEVQQAGERAEEVFGDVMPVNLPGRFRLAGRDGNCRLHANGLVAQCRVGKGSVLAIADAAVLEPLDAEIRAHAFESLLERAARD